MTSSNILVFRRPFRNTDLKGLSDPRVDCHAALFELRQFATGPIWDSLLLQRIEAVKDAALRACEIHHASHRDSRLLEWRIALERFYRVPRNRLRPEDVDVFKAFERLLVRFNSRVWLDI